jgi:DNA-binding FadR family transcriptional regulator
VQFNAAIEADDFEGIVQADMEFHDNIFKATRNEKLLQINNNLREQVQRFRIMYINKSNKSKDLARDHFEIAEAISKRNIDKAEKIAKIHIENAEKFILKMAGNTTEDK